MHRFIVDVPFENETIEVKDHALVHQIGRVLKLQTGEDVVLCDGAGTEVQVKLTDCTDISCTFQALQAPVKRTPVKRPVTLYASILKGTNFELAVEKAVEVGVKAVVPIIASRTIKKSINKQRLQKIIKEATEQSNRTHVPKLEPVVPLHKALQSVEGQSLFFDPSGTPVAPPIGETPVTIFVGPEGGWTPEEVAAAKASGCSIVSLGTTTLRAETAAVVASYVAAQS